VPDRRLQHPLYGPVPLLQGGYDPSYQPPLPPGAIRGDVTRQVYCCDVPKYFYVDEGRHCVQCGQDFVFAAREQKYWYESLQFNFSSVPVRCPACRRQRRSAAAVGRQTGLARRATETSPADPAAWLSLARALVEAHERTGHANLDEAIGAARRCAGLWPERAEPLLWEGVAQARSRRPARARACLLRFLERRQGVGRLLTKARHYLDEVSQDQ
jgi:hypothetical protein